MLCAVRVPGEPVLTTATACGTAVRSSLSSARLLQWSQTQAYASNVYYTPVSSKVAFDRPRVSWSWLQVGGMSCESGAQLQLHAAPLKRLHQYSAPCPKAGSHAWEEPTLPHDISLKNAYQGPLATASGLECHNPGLHVVEEICSAEL